MTIKGIYFLLLPILLLVSACDSYQKVLKSNDLEYKYTKAKEYYNEGNYYKAIPIFEELITVYKGTKSIDDIYYYYAYSQFGQDNFLIAAFHFKNIYTSYPNSKHAQECLYMTAFCYYKLSPRVSLEQTFTYKALEAFQLYLNTYPNSERTSKVNNLMDELHRKLEMKAFNAAEQYFRMNRYKAAAVSFGNFVKEFPASTDNEQAQFLIVKSYYQMAQNSIEEKKEERYRLAIDSYYTFVDKYPNSRYIKDAEQIYEASLKNLDKLQASSNEQSN